MTRIAAGLLCALALASGAARAEIYRCVAADGSVRFVGDAQACPGAAPHTPADRVQRIAPRDDGQEPAAPSPAGAPHQPPRLSDLFPPASALPGRWDVVKEAPEDPSQDPDLVSWGVRAKETRHYTWYGQQGIRVCSAELWGFASEAQAKLAEQNFSYPGWTFTREGSLLIMLRGVSRARGERGHRGVFPECAAVGERIAARARR
ncbi:MAG: hypothetical protein QNK04_25730 [Myxococcota bacterium]|nr:hypothetical protein [Myxococcota bacterium]